MTIQLKPKEDFSIDFAKFLIVRMKELFYASLDAARLNLLMNELNESQSIRDKFIGKVSLRKTLDYCINSLICIEYSNKWVITFDEKAYIPKSNMKVITFVQMINYGTLEITGYKIFDDTFNRTRKNLVRYREAFLKGII